MGREISEKNSKGNNEHGPKTELKRPVFCEEALFHICLVVNKNQD